MRATDARKVADTSTFVIYDIIKDIETLANAGFYEYVLNTSLTEEQISKLRLLDYKVFTLENGKYVVSW